MLSFVQSWFAPRANPIGVDFGSDCLRLAQVQNVGGEYRLVAAASADVPSHVRHSLQARLTFFVESVRDLLAQGQFHSRQAVLSLPASCMYIQHLRMAKMDEAETKKALPWEARGKLPIDPSAALIRHVIAGEVYQDTEPKHEVIVIAAAREIVNQFLAAAAKARLDVVGMNVEPKAIVDCFSHIYRRKGDEESTCCFLDMGWCGSRAVIANGQQIFFARTIPIGGEHFTKAVAQALNISAEEAKLLRIRLCHEQSGVDLAVAEGASQDPRASAVEQACCQPLAKLIEELDLCRRYHESTFPSKPVDRLIFVGGEASHRWMCQQIAKELGLAAQVGDPLSRMARTCDLGIASGIDRRHPQPAWAVAIGLSLGPLYLEQAAAASAEQTAQKD